jgi:hypothetical protein
MMNIGQALRIYAALLVLLAIEVLAAAFACPYRNGLIMSVAAGQFVLLLLFYLGIYRHRGWVQLFGWVYLCWMLVMVVFILGELQTR